MTAGPWLVRLGKVRGKGAYVHPSAWVDHATGSIEDGRLCFHQRDARRFIWRFTAEIYAIAFGGRVVRLRERAR